MDNFDFDVCIDQILPDELAVEAARLAVEENPENLPWMMGVLPPEPLHLALVTGKKWKPGRALRIRFLDGDATVQQKVAAVAKEWEKYANIKFDFGNDPEAEIRISFAQQGSWSMLGTDALALPKDRPTMNYGWLRPGTPDNQYHVVLHEFGHALGCIHEHQNPGGTINWNKEAAYQYYGRNGWSRQMVDQQVFQKYDRALTQFTAIDPKSIMMYPIPRQLTTDGFEVGINTTISETDRRFIAEMYPGAAPPPPDNKLIQEIVVNQPCKVQVWRL